jgi:hypothetical protein
MMAWQKSQIEQTSVENKGSPPHSGSKTPCSVILISAFDAGNGFESCDFSGNARLVDHLNNIV